MEIPMTTLRHAILLTGGILLICGCTSFFTDHSASLLPESKREIREKIAGIPVEVPSAEMLKSITLKPIFMEEYEKPLARYGKMSEDRRSFDITDPKKIQEILTILGQMRIKLASWRDNDAALPVSNDLSLNWKDGQSPRENELTVFGFYNSSNTQDESERKRAQVIVSPGSEAYQRKIVKLLDPGDRRGHLKWFSVSVTTDGLEAMKECLGN